MDLLKAKTPEKLYQSIGEFLQSDYSSKDLITFYDKARKCAHSLRVVYPILPAVPGCSDDALDGLQAIQAWCVNADKVADGIISNLRPQAIRETIGQFKKLREIVDSVHPAVNSTLRERIRNETTAKHNARRKELREQIEKRARTGLGISSPVGVELEVEAQLLREMGYVMPGQNSDVVRMYLSEDPTFQDRLSKLHVHEEIHQVIEKINKVVGSNTADGKLLDLYCRLKDIPLEKQFEDIGYRYSLEDLHDVIFGNCSCLYSSIDNVVQTLEQIQTKIKVCGSTGEGGRARDENQGTPAIDIIDDFCNWTDRLIDYIEHPDEIREVSKARIDTLGDQVNNLAKKIWPQISFDETGWPYQSLDNWGYLNRWEEGIFSAPREQKEKLIARLQQWKTRALEDKRKLREELRLQVNQEAHQPESPEGVLKAKAPEIFQNLLWMRKYGAKHWKLILLAAVILLILSMFVLPQFNVFSTIRSLLQNIRP